MSAIAGIIHFDGAPVSRLDIEHMSQALEPFGRNGESIAVGTAYGFVARTAHITPEDVLDRQPVTVNPHGLLLFDGRIDNRPELIRKLGLCDTKEGLLADSALAAIAWEHWGRDGLCHVIGSFSIAHWDDAERRLTLARSVGVRGRRLYVHRQGQRLYFASAPHGLFALHQVPRALNESALGDLLFRTSGAGETIYHGIEMVLTAHWAEYRYNGGYSKRYWTLEPSYRLPFKCEEEAWDAFHPLFEEVVRSHLRSIHPVGIQMSGGLDSAAVAGQAAHILAQSNQTLRGYTRVPAAGIPLPPDGLFYNDERPRVEEIVRMHPNLQPKFIDAGEEPVLDGLTAFFACNYAAGVFPVTHITGYQALYRQASVDGTRVLLTGAGGNTTVTYDGHFRLRDLLLQGRWLTLYRELQGIKRFRGSVRDLIKYFLVAPFISDDFWLMLERLRDREPLSTMLNPLVLESFAHASGARKRAHDRINARLDGKRHDGWINRERDYNRTGVCGTDSNQAQFGIDMRNPCLDRRIVEFCLALPEEFYLKDGISRRFARLGLSHLIPKSLRTDPTRGRQDVDWAYRMHRDAPAITRALDELTNDPVVCHYLDLEAMRTLWQRFEFQTSTNGLMCYSNELMGTLAVGLFIRWFEQCN